jgi:serine/threonine protein kinase
MGSENFVSVSLSRKQFNIILDLFDKSDQKLGDDRNQIKIVTHEQQKLVVKSFKVPNAVNKIAYRFFRKSKARRSYENALYLKAHDIGTPQPVAYYEELGATNLLKSYYISEYIDHDFTFREITNDDELQDKENILKQFTQFMYNMHEQQVYFLDHSPGNTLIRKVGENYEFYLVDLNRMKFYDIPFEERLKNFERLAPKRSMYEIMGTEYARLSGVDPKTTIDAMWKHTQDFQEAFHRKKRLKKKLKNIVS